MLRMTDMWILWVTNVKWFWNREMLAVKMNSENYGIMKDTILLENFEDKIFKMGGEM